MPTLTGKLVLNIRTALNEDAAQQQTVLTIDFDGCSDEAAKALMSRSIIIDRQRKYRKDQVIPGSDTVKVAELALKLVNAGPATLAGTAAQAKTLSLDEQRKLIADLQAQLATQAGAAELDKELETEVQGETKPKRK